MRIDRTMLPILVACLVALSATAARAEIVPPPPPNQGGGNYTATGPSASTTPTSFTIVMAGNLLGAAGIPSGSSGIIYEPSWADPFCDPSPSGNTCPVQVSYNFHTNQTTFVFSGSALYGNAGQAAYHFAFDITQGHYVAVPQSAYWTYMSGSVQYTASTPLANVACVCKYTKASLVAIVFYKAVYVKGTIAVGSWNIVSYIPNGPQQPKIKFTNFTAQPMEVSDTGIVLGIKPPTTPEGWHTLISMMNATNMPPPGASGSPFEPLLKPPPKVLKPEKLKLEPPSRLSQVVGKRS
jgi:hypothetical protein